MGNTCKPMAVSFQCMTKSTTNKKLKKKKENTSHCRGHALDPWSGRIPHASEWQSLCATTTEACEFRTCVLQQEKPLQWEARASQQSVAPDYHNWRKPSGSNKDPEQPKINESLKKQKRLFCYEASKRICQHPNPSPAHVCSWFSTSSTCHSLHGASSGCRTEE